MGRLGSVPTAYSASAILGGAVASATAWGFYRRAKGQHAQLGDGETLGGDPDLRGGRQQPPRGQAEERWSVPLLDTRAELAAVIPKGEPDHALRAPAPAGALWGRLYLYT